MYRLLAAMLLIGRHKLDAALPATVCALDERERVSSDIFEYANTTSNIKKLLPLVGSLSR